MRKKILFIFLISCGCSSIKKNVYEELNSENRIISIREYNYSYYFETVNLSSKDTNYVISLKDNYIKQNKMDSPLVHGKEPKTIMVNDTIRFTLTKALFRPIGFGNSGYSIIVEDDTLWTGEKMIDNRYFGSQNSAGLLINEWKKIE